MHTTALSADGPAFASCPLSAEPRAESPAQLAPAAAVAPLYGRWTLHGMECLMVRRRDGRLGCYIRVPRSHELYGRKDLSELSLVLSCPQGITYSAPGALGWFIGSMTEGPWEDAWDLLDDLAQQLVQFAASDATEPRVDRISGIRLRVAR